MEESAQPAQVGRGIVEDLQREIGKAIIGYEEKTQDLLTCLIANGHVLMEGVPGIAKTTFSKTFAQTLDISYGRIQFTQDLLPSDITGHYFYNQENRTFEIRKGPVFTELLLADEINRAPPKTQSALLEAMQEKHVTIEGTTLQLPEIFFVLATLNPIETEGVYSLPEAQLDRFMLKVVIDYPSEEQELDILELKSSVEGVPEKVLTRNQVFDMKKQAAMTHMHPSIQNYVKDIARATRKFEGVELGLSPRGAIHLLIVSRIHAYLLGRDYVIPDDVKAMAHKVINHRLILSPELDLEGVTVASVTDSVLSSVPVPKDDFGSESKSEE